MTVLASVDYRRFPDGVVRTSTRVGTLDRASRDILKQAASPVDAQALLEAHDAERVGRLVQEGWLVVLDELARRPTAGPPGSPILAIPTRGRPDKLRNLLADLAERGVSHPIRIAIDGTDAEVAQTRAVCASFGAPDLRVSTPVSRARAANALAHALGTSPSMLHVALAATAAPDGVERTGAGRNSLLLEAGTRPIVWLDDDVRLRGVTADGEPCWREHSPTFLSDPDATPDTEPLDPFAVMNPLGRAPTELVDLDAAWPHMGPWSVRALAAPAPPTVVLASGGLFGDEGTAGNAHRLFLTEGLGSRLLDRPDAWQRWRETRRSLRIAPGPTISPLPQFMTAWAATDTRGTLPPFLPGGRGADGAFAATLKLLRPEVLLAAIPAAILHEAPARQVSADSMIAGSCTHFLGNFITHLAADAGRDPARDAPTRLRRLGYELLGQVDGGPEATAARWTDWQQAENTRRLVLLRELRRSGPDVPAWRADVSSAIGALEDRLRTPRPTTPGDLPGWPAEDPNTWQVVGRILTAMGHLTLVWDRARDAWPTITSAFDTP